MKTSNLIATYWGLNAEELVSLYKKTHKVLDRAVVVSKHTLRELGESTDTVFFELNGIKMKEVYMASNGSLVTKADMTEAEIAEAISAGACMRFPIAEVDNKNKNEVTVYYGNRRKELLTQAYADVSKAIEEIGHIFSGIYGKQLEQKDVDSVDSKEITDIPLSVIEELLSITRTYAINKGLKNILEQGISDDVIENVVAEVNANYVYTALR